MFSQLEMQKTNVKNKKMERNRAIEGDGET
jgi:hypothetical protein